LKHFRLRTWGSYGEQVSTKLKVGVMWDHNGTYMEGFGFQYRDQTITVEINMEDKLSCTPFTFSLIHMHLIVPILHCVVPVIGS
jgi:hypothetical protein